MVRVLAEDHDTHLVERRQLERVEDPIGGRVEPSPSSNLGDEEGAELLHVRLLELVAEHRAPALVHPRLHGRNLRRPRSSGPGWVVVALAWFIVLMITRRRNIDNAAMHAAEHEECRRSTRRSTTVQRRSDGARMA